MAKMHDDHSRFLLSSIKNRVNHSIIYNLFNPLEILNLHSDGMISVDNNKNESLVNKSHFDIVNVHETKSITYSNAKFTNRIVYVSLQSITAILCFCFCVYFEEFFLFIFANYEPSNWELIFFCAPLIYLFSDFYRDKFAKPSVVTIQTKDGANKYLIGRLPDPQMHTASTVMVAIATYGIMIWAIDMLTYTKYGSTFEIILGFVFILFCLYLIYTGYISKREINGVNKKEISNDMIHFYFALNSIKYGNGNQIDPSSIEISDELKEIKKELQQYNNLMQSVLSAEQIFNASNPSMGVLAIGISTEAIMKQACERIGINFKPSAILTLDPLIKQYNREAGIESRIKSYLEIIKQMRNRAAHDFNINWQEFKTTLDQFCEVVKWYYSVFEESE